MILSIFPPAALLAADDRCGVPDEVNELIDTVSRYAAKDAVLSSLEQRQLRRELSRAQSVISAREDDLGLGGWKPAFDWMVIATQEASTTGRFSDPATLRSRVGVLIAGMRFSCNAGVSGGKGAALAGQADGTMKNRLKRFLEPGAADLTVLEQSLAGLFLVTFLVPIIIGAIWFAHWIIRTYHTEDEPLHPVSEPISTPPPPPQPAYSTSMNVAFTPLWNSVWMLWMSPSSPWMKSVPRLSLSTQAHMTGSSPCLRKGVAMAIVRSWSGHIVSPF
ncbi:MULTISPECIES: hypothetical protein [unclassified Aliiroseovarius]|uniref:hypothetical protein n=1 Tax=unclassified Aliiroseovarius TaxID=2623558 RepID=UPI0015691FF3|nr:MULTISPECIES: hypothetical protein [unclassified Aliiroseovarius]